MQEYIQFYNIERFKEKLHGLFQIEYREKAVGIILFLLLST
ncbi:TPA: hypothetical protein QCU24_004905 [Bacillus cereus]|nr:hypothetical protein [Bacillus cereus]